MRITKSILLLLAAAAVVLPASAGELQGVTLADEAEVGGESLGLTGMALRKVAIIKVYVAGLYLPSGGREGAAVLAADEPRRIVNHYLRGAGGDRICNGWMEGLEANTPDASADVEAGFQQLCDWMGGVEKDDVFEFTYVPGEGTTLAGPGREPLTIAGKEFADALFACWIGPDPGPGQKFRQQLLGLS